VIVMVKGQQVDYVIRLQYAAMTRRTGSYLRIHSITRLAVVNKDLSHANKACTVGESVNYRWNKCGRIINRIGLRKVVNDNDTQLRVA
jgi:hypothetical protein